MSPRYRICAGKCQAGAGATWSSMNRDRTRSAEPVKVRYPLDTLAPVPALRSNPSGDVGLAGSAVGRGEGPVLLGAVVADGMDPDDFPIAGDLH